MMFESGIELLLIIPLLLLDSGFQELLGGFGLLRGGVSINNTHFVNNVCPLRPEVSYENIPLQISLVL